MKTVIVITGASSGFGALTARPPARPRRPHRLREGSLAAPSQGRVDTGGRSGLEDATAERPSPDQGAMATLRPYGRMQLM